MKRTTPLSSSAEDRRHSLDLSLPTSWEQMTPRQLQAITKLMAAGIEPERLKYFALLRFSGLGVLRHDGDEVLVCRGIRRYVFSVITLSAASRCLDFLDTLPPVPVRPLRLGHRRALDAELHGIPFGVYLQVENLWQALLADPESGALLPLCRILWPGLRRLPRDGTALTAVTLWLTGLKNLLSRNFTDLFRPAPAGGEQPDRREVMLALVRALTGGDVTREKAVLEADTWSALAELDAKAREAQEMRRK